MCKAINKNGIMQLSIKFSQVYFDRSSNNRVRLINCLNTNEKDRFLANSGGGFFYCP
jgi:hypothetical protein